MEKAKWEFGAPSGKHCCSVECEDNNSIAVMTHLNPADGGDPLYYCYDCYERMERLNER